MVLAILLAVLAVMQACSAAEVVHFLGDGKAAKLSFDSLVSSSSSLWVVAINYGVQEEAAMESIEAIMESLVTKFSSYDINLGILDCTKSENKKACLANKPTTNSPIAFSLYFDKPNKNPYTNIMYREAVAYPGVPASNRDLEKFVNKQLQPKNLKIVEFVDVKSSVSSLDRPAILVFSEKKSNPNVFLRSIFAKYSEVQIFFVPTPDKESNIEEFQYDNLPSMFFVDPSLHEKAAKFGGEITDRSAVINWIDSVISTSSISKKSAASAEKSSGVSPSKFTDEYFKSALTDPESKGDKSAKTIHEAVIAVVASSASSELAGWDKALSTSMTGSILPMEVICDKGESAGDGKTLGDLLCKDRVDGKPYVLILAHGTSLTTGKSYYKLPYVTYDQKKHSVTDSEEWIKSIGKTLPETVVEMLPEDENSINYFLQMSITKEVLPIVIFSQKQVVSSVIRNTAMGTAGKVAFGFVFISSEDSNVHRSFGVGSLPAVVAMQPQPETEQMKTQRLEQEAKARAAGKGPKQPDPADEDGNTKIMIVPRPYSTKQFGALTYNNLKLFAIAVLESGYYPNRLKREQENDNSDSNSNSVKIITPVDVDGADQWNSACSSKFRGLCIMYLHDGSEASGAAGRALLGHIGSSPDDPSKTIRDAMKLINLNAQCQFNFLSTFGIDMTSLPMVLVISPLKLKYSIYRGAISPHDVGEFVGSIFKGKGSTAPLSLMPTLESRTGADFLSCLKSMEINSSGDAGSLTSSESDEDARLNAEILEEIKRDEEEKKKRLIEEEKARKQKAKEDKLKAEQEEKEKKAAPKKKKKKSKKSKEDKEL